MIVVAGVAAAWCVWPVAVTQAAPAAGGSGAWGVAIEVPGTAALNAGGSASVGSMSCGSAGNCVAGGFYTSDEFGNVQAFVVSERNGRWGKAIKVPGTARLNVSGDAGVTSVSCPSAGNCAASGFYFDGLIRHQAFVVSERNGRWAKAIKVPGTARLNAGEYAFASSVSCSSAGNCAVGGSYEDRFTHPQAFVASERNGRWAKAIEVPGTAALNAGGSASVSEVSCGSAGNCAAGGSYTGASGHSHAFVVSERDGRWAKAIEVPGKAALNAGANVTSVSCGSAGNCAVGGFYRDGSHHQQAFVVSERDGLWGKAIEVPGTAALNAGGNAGVDSVSCPSAGNCAVGGFYRDGSHHLQAFVARERNGRWTRAREMPGTATLNAGGNAGVTVSCPSAGNCAAGGFYKDGSHHEQAFVASERDGRWAKAIEVPGTAALNAGGSAGVGPVSCGSAGSCAAGGSYTDGSGRLQAFVVTGP